MGKIVIYKNEVGVAAATDSSYFNNTADILKFVNNNNFKILKYEQDNLYLTIKDIKIKIEKYSTFARDHVLYDFNRKVRFQILKFDKKLALQQAKHEFLRVKSREASAFVLGTMIVAQLVLPNANFKKAENNVNVVEPPAIEKSAPVQIKPVISTTLIKYENVYSYSKSFGIPYDNAVDYIMEKGVNINNNSLVLETLYKYSRENVEKVPNELNQAQIEELIIKYSNELGVTDSDVLATMLAVFRLETGNATSPVCVEGNNFGGHRWYDHDTKEYYVTEYKTPEIGAYRHVAVFLDIMERTMQKETYDPNKSLESNLNPMYCGEAWWHTSVSEIKKEVEVDYADILNKKVR